ncbi:MAG: hypothetical protein K5888_07095 [Lachnospiraceae bacterium]|nr:hypothetical protein [Lachnospiraceae bacterium]
MKKLDDMKGQKTSYEPYKYVMSDVGNIYIGARYTYRELLDNEDVNFKLKAVITHYILKDSDESNSLESELYFLKPQSNVFAVFEQLRPRIKVLVLKDHKGFLGRRETRYEESVLTLKELTETDEETKKGEGMVISEIAISKLALMSFTV